MRIFLLALLVIISLTASSFAQLPGKDGDKDKLLPKSSVSSTASPSTSSSIKKMVWAKSTLSSAALPVPASAAPALPLAVSKKKTVVDKLDNSLGEEDWDVHRCKESAEIKKASDVNVAKGLTSKLSQESSKTTPMKGNQSMVPAVAASGSSNRQILEGKEQALDPMLGSRASTPTLEQPKSASSSRAQTVPILKVDIMPSTPRAKSLMSEEQFHYSPAHTRAANGEGEQIIKEIKETGRYRVLKKFLNTEKPEFVKVERNMGIDEKLRKFKEDYDAKRFEPVDISGLSSRARIELIRKIVEYKRTTLPKHKCEDTRWQVREFYDCLPTTFKIGLSDYTLNVNPTMKQPGNGEVKPVESYKEIVKWLQDPKYKANIPKYIELLLIQRKYGDPINTGNDEESKFLNGLNLLLDFEVARRLTDSAEFIDGDEFKDLPVLIHIEDIIRKLEIWSAKKPSKETKTSSKTYTLENYPYYLFLFIGDKRPFFEHDIANLDGTQSRDEAKLSEADLRRKLESSHKADENSEDEGYFEDPLSAAEKEQIASEYFQREKDTFLETITARYIQKLRNDNEGDRKILLRKEMKIFAINEIFREELNGSDLIPLPLGSKTIWFENDNLVDLVYEKLKELNKLDSMITTNGFGTGWWQRTKDALKEVVYSVTSISDRDKALKKLPYANLNKQAGELADSIRARSPSRMLSPAKQINQDNFALILETNLTPPAVAPNGIDAAKKSFSEELDKIVLLAKELRSKEFFNFVLNQAIVKKVSNPVFIEKFKNIKRGQFDAIFKAENEFVLNEVMMDEKVSHDFMVEFKNLIHDRFKTIFEAKTDAQLSLALNNIPVDNSLRYEAEFLARKLNKLPNSGNDERQGSPTTTSSSASASTSNSSSSEDVAALHSIKKKSQPQRLSAPIDVSNGQEIYDEEGMHSTDLPPQNISVSGGDEKVDSLVRQLKALDINNLSPRYKAKILAELAVLFGGKTEI